MNDPIYYVNGNFVPASQAAVSLRDLGLVRGYGVFDFLRTYHGKPFHLNDHIERLKKSAGLIDIEFPFANVDDLADIVYETLGHNDFRESTIRLVLTGGVSDSFFLPDGPGTLAVMIAPVKNAAAGAYTRGVSVTTTRLQRELPHVKSLNYIGAIMAMKRAVKKGAVEALYVDPTGTISEGTRSNFFGIKDGVLITSEEGILEGITRRVVLSQARPHFPIELRPLSLDEIGELDEAFLTSSTKEVMPVVAVEGVRVGRGRPGPITRRLIAMFRQYATGAPAQRKEERRVY